MASNREAASIPALVLMYGVEENKRRLLNKDAVIVGRARGCDIVLDAPDISTLHCVVTRTSGGYTIRDCGSRAGTRLNGDSIQEATIRDGDVVQIGPFSFEVSIPARDSAKVLVRPARLDHLDRSRRNLTRLALNLRRKLNESDGEESASSTNHIDLRQKASGLRQRVRDYEQRRSQLEQEERELAEGRELLACEQAQLEERAAAFTKKEQAFAQECVQRQEQLNQAAIKIEKRRAEVEASLIERQEQLQRAERLLAQDRQAFDSEVAAFQHRERDHERRSEELERALQQMSQDASAERAAFEEQSDYLQRSSARQR